MLALASKEEAMLSMDDLMSSQFVGVAARLIFLPDTNFDVSIDVRPLVTASA